MRKIFAKSEWRGYKVNLVLSKNQDNQKAYIWAASNGLPAQIGNQLFFLSIEEAIAEADKCGMNVRRI